VIYFLIYSSILFANDKPKKSYILSYGKVEGFIESKNSGVGIELLTEIIKRLENRGHKFILRFQPFKRVIKTFIHNEIDVAFPIINGGSFKKAGYDKWGFENMPAHSIPMFTSGGFVIYSKENKTKYNSVESLIGKSIAVIRGAYIPSEIKGSKDILITEVNKGIQSFEMLKRDRIDAFLVHKFWAKGILKESKLDGFEHGDEFDTIIGGFIFHQNQEGLNLLAEFNYVIATMILDGSYNKILKKYPNNKMVIRYPN
jgi:hypothetical protein